MVCLRRNLFLLDWTNLGNLITQWLSFQYLSWKSNQSSGRCWGDDTLPECTTEPAAWQHWDCWRQDSPLLCWGKPGRRWVCSSWWPHEAFRHGPGPWTDWWKDQLGLLPPGTSAWLESWCQSNQGTRDLLRGCSLIRWTCGRREKLTYCSGFCLSNTIHKYLN